MIRELDWWVWELGWMVWELGWMVEASAEMCGPLMGGVGRSRWAGRLPMAPTGSLPRREGGVTGRSRPLLTSEPAAT